MNTTKKKYSRLYQASAAALATVAGLQASRTQAAITANSSSGSLSVHQGTYTPPASSTAVPVPAVDISFAGQTALKAFLGGPGISLLQPGTSATYTFPLYTYSGGTYQSVWYVGGNTVSSIQTVTATYSAPADPSGAPGTTLVQLASKNFTSPDKNPNNSAAAQQTDSALRLEWHGEGSVQGELDLINDQVGFYPGQQITADSSRGPSGSNIDYVNQNQFNTTSPQGPLNGLQLSQTGYGNTYNSSVYDLPTGISLVGAANRVQFSIGEYKTEGLAQSGTGTALLAAGTGSYNSTVYNIGSGYGTGNPYLTAASSSNIAGLGVATSRQQFQPATVVNESTDKVDPQSATSQTYGQEYGTTRAPWATAGANNISSTQFAATAVGFVANPGTGLSRLNLGDAQWLETTSRLQNGASFDFVSRDVNTGQRVVSALNTGVDPSWAVGKNDGGNTTGTNTNQQSLIGPGLRFSGKTSGSEAESTIAQSRLAVGALSIAEARGSVFAAPVRELDVDFNSENAQLSTGTNSANDGTTFSRINFDNIISNNDATRWKAVLISQFNTIKTPNLAALNAYEIANGLPTNGSADATAWAALNTFNPTNKSDTTATGIKGDPFGNVNTFLSNVVNSTGSGSLSYITTGTLGANNPADALFSNGYLIPGLLNYTRTTDGGDITPQAGNATEQSAVDSAYGQLFTAESYNGYARSAASNTETVGVNAQYAYYNSTYTQGDPSGSLNGGSVAITAKNSDGTGTPDGTFTPYGNWLFGNFNQTGTRDFASVEEANFALLALHHTDGHNDSIFAADGGVANSTSITPASFDPNAANGWDKQLGSSGTLAANTKGDLIVLGDANGDGKFDGSDLYLLDTGAALSDNPAAPGASATGLTSASGIDLSDQLTNPNDKLNKNAALQYSQQETTPLATDDGYNADRLWVRQSGRVTLTGSSLPLWATEISATPGPAITYTYTYDPTGNNTFNERDVNHTGQVDLDDAFIIDKFAGESVGSIDNQLSAAINVNGTINPVGTQQTINLAIVSQVDSNTSPVIGQWDENHLTSSGTGTLASDAGLNSAFNYFWYSANKIGGLKIDAEPAAGSQFAVPTGTVFTISSGQFVAGGAVDLFTDNTNGTGGTTPGTHLSILNNSIGTTGTFGTSVSPYGLVISSTAAGGNNIGTLEGSGSTWVTAGAKLTATHIRQASLNIGTGATVTIPSNTNPGNPAGVSVLTDLSNTGSLDLKNNALIVNDPAQSSSIIAAVANAADFNPISGTNQWDKPGITSTSAQTNASTYALGSLTGTELTNLGSTTFQGQPTTSNSTVVAYTLIGDTELRGTVDGTDYNNVLANYDTAGDWSQGNFYNESIVSGDDYNAVLNAYDVAAAGGAKGLKPAITRSLSPTVSQVGSPVATSGTFHLEVNTTSGDVTLFNDSTSSAPLTLYNIVDGSQQDLLIGNPSDGNGTSTSINSGSAPYTNEHFLSVAGDDSNAVASITGRSSTNYKAWSLVLDGYNSNATALALSEGGQANKTDTINVPSFYSIDLGDIFNVGTTTVALTFQWGTETSSGGEGGTVYSNQPIDYVGTPEPASLGLLGLGGLAMMRRRRKASR
jgi:hypothetical protein